MVRPSNRSKSNVTRSILPSCSIHGIWGRMKTSYDGLANNKRLDTAGRTSLPRPSWSWRSSPARWVAAFRRFSSDVRDDQQRRRRHRVDPPHPRLPSCPWWSGGNRLNRARTGCDEPGVHPRVHILHPCQHLKRRMTFIIMVLRTKSMDGSCT